MNDYHTSVLLQETIDGLLIHKGEKYIDATLGGVGHTSEIIKRGGNVLGLDVDVDALENAKNNKKEEIENGSLVVAKGNFKDIDSLARENGFSEVSGVLFDLGVSSHHFDEGSRGFSVKHDGPLDMRMDQDLGVKAADLIAILTKGELYDLFTKFGEERFAYTISNSIVRARQIKPITTTAELVAVVSRAVPKKQIGVHPATRIFQALRIAVNDELTSIDEALPKALGLLKTKGRLAIISFHSLEDRIVKNMFKAFEEQEKGTIITKKPIVPTEEEIEVNNRSRSAKLRIFEKI